MKALKNIYEWSYKNVNAVLSWILLDILKAIKNSYVNQETTQLYIHTYIRIYFQVYTDN